MLVVGKKIMSTTDKHSFGGMTWMEADWLSVTLLGTVVDTGARDLSSSKVDCNLIFFFSEASCPLIQLLRIGLLCYSSHTLL